MSLFSEPEAEVFRFLEVLTLDDPPYVVPHCPMWEACVSRGWLERCGFGWQLTAAGWRWLAARFERVLHGCRSGQHDWAKKHPSHYERHCRWCGTCEFDRCPDCNPTYAGPY